MALTRRFRFWLFRLICKFGWKVCPPEDREVMQLFNEIGWHKARQMINEEQARRRRKDFTVVK